jgi:hypothetical protein
MSVRIISRRLDPREITVRLVDGSTIKGKINLYSEESATQRVSDLFTKSQDPFLVMFDATVEGNNGKVCILNKHNVVWVSPEDDQK